MSSPWIERLREKLAAARALAASPDAAAAFSLSPPVAEDALLAFERENGVRLPDAYRELLTSLGNGGVGPDYGLTPLEKASMPDELPEVTVTITSKDGGQVSAGSGPRPRVERAPKVSLPFRMKEGWTVHDKRGQPRRLPLEPAEHPYDGCVVLSEIGCGYFTFLVVNGEGAGQVWADYTAAAGDAGMGPMGTDFAGWYEGWLDDTLRNALLGKVQAALSGKGALSQDAHALVSRYEGLFHAGAERAHAVAARATVELYLDKPGEAEASLGRAEALDPKLYALPQLRRWLFASDFAGAAGEDDATLREKARHRAEDVRFAVAANARAPEDVLSVLAGDESHAVQRAAAANASATRSVVARAASAALDGWGDGTAFGEGARFFALEAAARNAHAPEDLLARLARADRDGGDAAGPLAVSVVRAAATNPSVPESLLASLAAHDHPAVRHAVALHPRAPAAAVDALARDADPFVRAAVASREDTSPALFLLLAADPSIDVKKAAIWNPRTPGAAIAPFVCVASRDLVFALAHAAQLPAAARGVLEHHPFYYAPAKGAPDLFACWPLGSRKNNHLFLRLDATAFEAVTGGYYSHPSFPPALMPPFVEEQYRLGGMEMASHPWLPQELLEKLAGDAYGYTRARIAEHPRAGAAVLAHLADDKTSLVRAAAARSPRADAAIAERLAADPASDVRSGAAQHPGISARTLATLAHDPERWVRRDVLLNPSTPPDLVDALAADADPQVRKWASLNPNARPDTIARLAADADAETAKWATWRADADAYLAGSLS